MIENLKRIYQQETLAERSQRMIPAAAYGALIATGYVWALALVNVFRFPELPLGMDWGRVLGMWIRDSAQGLHFSMRLQAGSQRTTRGSLAVD